MTFTPAAPGWALLAATPLAGVALVNATPTILSWTAPADGQQHRVMALASQLVTSPETGGQVNFSGAIPSPGGTANNPLFNGGSGNGSTMSFGPAMVVAPGATVTVNQASALTAGAATVWAELWGS